MKTKEPGLKEEDILSLPDAPDFISTPPKYTLDEMIAICEKMLPFWNAQRLERKGKQVPSEPFVL